MQSIGELVELADLTQRSNSLLIEGWNEADNNKWQQGWDLRRSTVELYSQPDVDWFE